MTKQPTCYHCGQPATHLVSVTYGPETPYCAIHKNRLYADAFVSRHIIAITKIDTLLPDHCLTDWLDSLDQEDDA